MTATTQISTDEMLAKISGDFDKLNNETEHERQLDVLHGIAEGKKVKPSYSLLPSWLSFAAIAAIAAAFGLMAGLALF